MGIDTFDKFILPSAVEKARQKYWASSPEFFFGQARNHDIDAINLLFDSGKGVISRAFWKYYLGPNRAVWKQRIRDKDDWEFASEVYAMLVGQGKAANPLLTFDPSTFKGDSLTFVINKFNYYLLRYCQNLAWVMNREKSMEGMTGNMKKGDHPRFISKDTGTGDGGDGPSMEGSFSDMGQVDSAYETTEQSIEVQQFLTWIQNKRPDLYQVAVLGANGFTPKDIEQKLGISAYHIKQKQAALKGEYMKNFAESVKMNKTVIKENLESTLVRRISNISSANPSHVKRAARIIAGWYDAEFVGDEEVRAMSNDEFIDDIYELLNGAGDDNEIQIVQKALGMEPEEREIDRNPPGPNHKSFAQLTKEFNDAFPLDERADKNTDAGSYKTKSNHYEAPDKKKSKKLDLSIGDVVALNPNSAWSPDPKKAAGLYAVVTSIKTDDTVSVEAENGAVYKLFDINQFAKIKENLEPHTGPKWNADIKQRATFYVGQDKYDAREILQLMAKEYQTTPEEISRITGLKESATADKVKADSKAGNKAALGNLAKGMINKSPAAKAVANRAGVSTEPKGKDYDADYYFSEGDLKEGMKVIIKPEFSESASGDVGVVKSILGKHALIEIKGQGLVPVALTDILKESGHEHFVCFNCDAEGLSEELDEVEGPDFTEYLCPNCGSDNIDLFTPKPSRRREAFGDNDENWNAFDEPTGDDPTELDAFAAMDDEHGLDSMDDITDEELLIDDLLDQISEIAPGANLDDIGRFLGGCDLETLQAYSTDPGLAVEDFKMDNDLEADLEMDDLENEEPIFGDEDTPEWERPGFEGDSEHPGYLKDDEDLI